MAKSTVIRRDFSKIKKTATDTFKLKVSNFKKNISFDPTRPIWDLVEHCHFFHTFDSDGRQQKECTATGGHKHQIDIEFNDKGELVKANCSPAIGCTDGHIHELLYLGSDEIEMRVRSEDVSRLLAGLANDPRDN